MFDSQSMRVTEQCSDKCKLKLCANCMFDSQSMSSEILVQIDKPGKTLDCIF
jgi:hypothetical protein